MITLLGDGHVFPPVHTALVEPDGLLAIGGDLSVGRLLAAYRQGIFPWFSPGDPLLWWSPSRRMVLLPGGLRLTRSLRKSMRNKQFDYRLDSDFEAVIRACAAPRDGQGGTWITEDIIQAYLALHHEGYAHSYEVWQHGRLVGGLYGVALGRMFYGESMFHRVTDASKAAFACMASHLFSHGFSMIDAQMFTPHLESLGAQLLEREAFVARLKLYTVQPQPAGMWRLGGEHESS